MQPSIAVIGCGVIGLTTALQLQKDVKNAQITIIADKLSPNTTSNVAAGLWGPYLLGDTPESDIIKWSKITHDRLLNLWRSGLAENAGICLIPAFRYVAEDNSYQKPSWSKIPFGFHQLTSTQLDRLNKKYNQKYTDGYSYVTFTCESTKLLPFLLEEFFENGGNLQLKKINSFDELVEYDVVVNCTGPDAKHLTQDEHANVIRGQIVRVMAPWQFHVLLEESDAANYIIPNSKDVILGGTHQVNDHNLEPDPADKANILKGCFNMSSGLQTCTVQKDGVGLRPGRTAVRLEIEKYLTNNKMLNIVHNYGHGGAGVTLCFGCAADASGLVKSLMTSKLQSRL